MQRKHNLLERYHHKIPFTKGECKPSIVKKKYNIYKAHIKASLGYIVNSCLKINKVKYNKNELCL
jgi:hypothetical protein